MTTQLTDKIAALKIENAAKLERKVKELTIKEKLLELTGLDFMVLIHSDKSTSIWIENDQHNNNSKFDRFKIKDYYKSICQLFVPECKPLTFASSKQIENFAPVKIDFNNYFSEITFNHTQTAKIIFTFEGGVNLSFSFPSSPNYGNFSKDVLSTRYADLKPGRKDPYTKALYYIHSLGKVAMYGNNYYSYCENPEQLNDFMNVVFTGNK